MENTELRVFLSKNCSICSELHRIISSLIDVYTYKSFAVKFIYGVGNRDFHKHGVTLKVVPTLLAYKDNKLRLGWEGFAYMAPDDIKLEMVEDVLAQVAALENEF